MILVYDVETTGFPSRAGFDRYFDYRDSARYDGARVVQLCALLFDGGGARAAALAETVRPDGFTIENSHVHGVTTEAALRAGRPFAELAAGFGALLERADLLVAHNAAFDQHVLAAELHRQGFGDLAEALARAPHACTMREGTALCKLPLPAAGPSQRSRCRQEEGYKSPRLQELHQQLFGAGFANPHNAEADACATARCFFEMRSGRR